MAGIITSFIAGIVAGIIKNNIEAILAGIIVGKNEHFLSINPGIIISVINGISLNIIWEIIAGIVAGIICREGFMACNITQILRVSLLVYLHVHLRALSRMSIRFPFRVLLWVALLSVSLQLLWPVSLWVYSFMERLMTLLMRS